MAPKNLLDNYEVVQVEGRGDIGLWLPVLPMAWDNDTDPVLAIVGAAFLVLLPMQIWSSALRTTRAKLILWIWALLLLMGMVCALVAEQYIQFWSFPQLRFCPSGYHDDLPLMNDGTQTVGGVWDGTDRDHWNRTVQNRFINNTDARPLSNICIYPCFDTSWPLRDPNEIIVVVASETPAFETDTFFRLMIAAYALVTTTAISSLTVAILTNVPPLWTFYGYRLRLHSEKKLKLVSELGLQMKRAWRSRDVGRGGRAVQLIFYCYCLVIYLYTFFASPGVVLFFVAFMEWVIWGSDPGGESFHHVGQWNAIVGLVLVVGAAIISHRSESAGHPSTDEADPASSPKTGVV